MSKEEKKFRGYVMDRLGTVPAKKTKFYFTYREAHEAAEKLCSKTLGERGAIFVAHKDDDVED